MSLTISFRAAALRELEEAADWYEKRNLGLGEEFLREIEDLIGWASDFLERYPIVHQDVRKAVARRFPYAVFFRVRRQNLIVLAVFHGRRDPRAWISR